MHMARKIRTTVVVTAAAEMVLQRHRHNFGLKGPLSVGLMLFDALPAEEKIDKTRQVEEADRDPHELIMLLRDTVLALPEKRLTSLLDSIMPNEAELIRRYREIAVAQKEAQSVVRKASREAPATRPRKNVRR